MTRSAAKDEQDIIVSEHEGTVLAMIARWQPATRYQLLRAFGRSPVSSYNTSKGSLYPLVSRMMSRGFLVAEIGKGARESELISLSPLGYQALRGWIMDIGPQHSLIHDPLHVRILALGELAPEDRVRWIASAESLLAEKKAELGNYHEALRVPFNEVALNFGTATIDAKMRWLNKLLGLVVGSGDASERHVSFAKEDDRARMTRR
jgi:DNA-binding PadR family transcriptional regulator